MMGHFYCSLAYVAGGVHGSGGHAWQLGGGMWQWGCTWLGAYVAGCVHGRGAYVAGETAIAAGGTRTASYWNAFLLPNKTGQNRIN